MKPLIIAASLLLCANAQAATIYKWVDKNGSVHYSNERPPADVKATIIDTTEPVRAEPVSTPRAVDPASEPAPSPEADPSSKRSLKEQEADFAKRRAARLERERLEEEGKAADAQRLIRACDRARTSLERTVASPPRLAQRNEAPRADVWVYRGSEAAELPSMNSAERSETIDRLETFIVKNCGKVK